GGVPITSAPPGTTVVIVGSNLGSSGKVTFDGITAATTSWTATGITATVPVAASYPDVGPVVVSVGGQTATGANFTILAPLPTITDYQDTGGASTTSALPGTQVVIVGSNLGSSGTVSIAGIPAVATTWTATAITVTVPVASSYPATGPIRVSTGGQTAA